MDNTTLETAQKINSSNGSIQKSVKWERYFTNKHFRL